MVTYRRLLGFLRPYRRALWGSLIFAWAAMGVTVLIPWLVGEAVNAIEAGNRPDLLPLALAIFGVAILRLGLTVVRRLIAGRVSLSVEVDLREQLYRHLHRLELGFFDNQQVGQLMSRATVDLQAIRFFLGYGLIFLTQAMLTIVLATVVMLVINPGLALLALSPLPIAVYVATRYQMVARPAQQEVQQRIGELTAQAEESVSGIRVIKAFAREEHQLFRFRRAIGRVFEQTIYTTRLQAIFTPLIGFLPQIGTALVLLVGGRQVIGGSLSLGEFTAFYTYMLMLAGPVRTLGMALAMSQRAIASGNRFFEILDRRPLIQSEPDAVELPAGGGRVEFDRVSLTYPGTNAAALDQVSLVAEAGSTVALAGPSGSGKTSLVSLIARLYDPNQGTVRIDDLDLKRATIESLRDQVAFVSDESFLFSAPIADNIAYARPGADRDQIVAAARRAQADDFIRELPEGYDTVVGERGLTLSGGQRQRVAIARALLADPRVLILDDATSSVDATTERAIREALAEVMRGRTTFVIAHRLSTLALADEIVVLDRGRVVDRGRHEELLGRCGFYAEIAQHGTPDSVFLQRDLEPREEMARL